MKWKAFVLTMILLVVGSCATGIASESESARDESEEPAAIATYAWESRHTDVTGHITLYADGTFKCDSGYLVKYADFRATSPRDKADRPYPWRVEGAGIRLTFHFPGFGEWWFQAVGRSLLVGRYIGRNPDGEGHTAVLRPLNEDEHRGFLRFLAGLPTRPATAPDAEKPQQEDAAKVEERIERLEAKVAALKEAISTRRVNVVDAEGRVRAVLEATERGPRFRMFDETAMERFSLDVTEFGPVLRMRGERNELRAHLTVTEYGTIFRMRDEKGELRASPRMRDEGPGLWMHDEKRDLRVALGIVEGRPRLSILDEKGEVRCAIGASNIATDDGRRIMYPESSILLFDADGGVVWEAP